ncbi:Ureohydrolase [Moelleriella libera RCEF 2490]|uniref:Ureohydrolase n=1 Tax=Moelleriella libera RCEF 2490 TaxID=1081109 RepID=A0A168EY36_9HYPO|nr:Ureohydrolase [Moelleriella libera RCEF 2490]
MSSACNGHHDKEEWTKEELAEMQAKWGADWQFTGIGTFAHLDYAKCLVDPSVSYDIAIVGARFGPRAIRQASSRQTSTRGFNARAKINPYRNWAKIIDCGDIPITPFDNVIAREQMTQALKELGSRRAVSALSPRPRLLTLGGDHSLTLPALRALNDIYGRPVRVLHFDGMFTFP